MDKLRQISPAEMQIGEIAHAWVSEDRLLVLARVSTGYNLIYDHQDNGGLSCAPANAPDLATILLSLTIDIVKLTWYSGPPRSADDAPEPPAPTEAQEAASAIVDLQSALNSMAIHGDDGQLDDLDLDTIIESLDVAMRALKAWGGIATRQPDPGVQWGANDG